MPLRVGIVGGSISGCMCALELLRAGHDVRILERAAGSFEGLRGAGLGTPSATFEQMVNHRLVDRDIPHLSVEEMDFVGRDGSVPLSVPLDFISFHWGDLWNGLRARVPDETYEAGRPVTDLQELDDEFDVVVCADGHDSAFRRELLPGTEPEYQGYVCWRGVVDEADLAASGLEGARFARFGAGDLPGSFIYPVPGPGGAVEPGHRSINIGCYLLVPEQELPDHLVDRWGRHHHGALPPGGMRPDEEARLKAIARDFLPAPYADLVDAAEETFVQAIHAVEVPAYREGRVCLTGDAGTLTPPFTGSGIFKAAANAIGLGEALASGDEVDASLERWSSAQATLGASLFDLGRQYHAAFIERQPDFAAMDEAEASAWWRRSVAYPAGFTFEAT